MTRREDEVENTSLLLVTTRDGKPLRLQAKPGLSVMEIIRDAGVDELLATCGGCCACGTCHVYIDPLWLERLPRIREEEDELLSMSDHRRPTSRLGCQLLFTRDLDGLPVNIAPEE
jgi:ferredoxin, 2Fe-2S